MILSIQVVYPYDCMADWDMGQPAADQHREDQNSKYHFYWDTWLAQSEHMTPDLGVVSSSPTWGVGIT